MTYLGLFKSSVLLMVLTRAAFGATCPCHLPGSRGRIAHIRLRAAQGGYFDLCEGSRKPVLLAFLRVIPDSADTASRSQAVFLSSMYQQYGRRGLGVVAVETSGSSRQRRISHRALANASYDWRLDFPLLEDAGIQAKKAFGVTVLPSVLLLAPDGKVVERWNGLASPAALARAVETLLGGLLSQLPRSAVIPSVTP